jgi:chromosome segregation ATPase
MDEQVTDEKCPCNNCLVSSTCAIIEDCEKWFSFFVKIVDKLPQEISNNEPILEGVNTNNMRTLRELIDKMLSTESTLVDLENTVGELQGRIDVCEKDNLQESEIRSISKEVTEEYFSDIVPDFETRLDEFQHEIEDLQNLDEKISDIENKLENNDISKIDDIEMKADDLESKFDDLECDVSQLKDNEYDMQDLRDKIDKEIVKDIAALKQSQISVTEINGQLIDLNDRVNDLNDLIPKDN